MKKIYYGKAVYDSKEINAVIKVLKNNSLSLVDGVNVKALEKIVSRIFGKRYGLMVNSGSSANLLALASFNFKEDRNYNSQFNFFYDYCSNIPAWSETTFYWS